MRTIAAALLLAGLPLPLFAQNDAFNPAVSVILDGRFTSYGEESDHYELPGFQLGGEAGLAEEGFSLGHTEVVMSSNIDDFFYGQFTAAFHEEGVELEEAFLETLSLGEGFTARGGRFFSGVGYLNDRHPHAWDFADAPLMYRALFGDQLADVGAQLRWVAPTDLFLQVGLEAFRGDSFPAAGGEGGAGSGAAFLKLGGDIGASHSWQLGVFHIDAQAEGRSGAGHSHTHGEESEEEGGAVAFSGDSRISGIDLVWKWAPEGNPRQRNLKVAWEVFEREESGELAHDLESGPYRGTQRGGYIEAVYQFMPRWRTGVRYDRLTSDNRGDAELLAEAGLDDEGHTPQRWSVMLDYSRSEFSRLRLQFNRDDSSPERNDQLLLQYVVSLGAHGAHKF